METFLVVIAVCLAIGIVASLALLGFVVVAAVAMVLAAVAIYAWVATSFDDFRHTWDSKKLVVELVSFSEVCPTTENPVAINIRNNSRRNVEDVRVRAAFFDKNTGALLSGNGGTYSTGVGSLPANDVIRICINPFEEYSEQAVSELPDNWELRASACVTPTPERITEFCEF